MNSFPVVSILIDPPPNTASDHIIIFYGKLFLNNEKKPQMMVWSRDQIVCGGSIQRTSAVQLRWWRRGPHPSAPSRSFSRRGLVKSVGFCSSVAPRRPPLGRYPASAAGPIAAAMSTSTPLFDAHMVLHYQPSDSGQTLLAAPRRPREPATSADPIGHRTSRTSGAVRPTTNSSGFRLSSRKTFLPTSVHAWIRPRTHKWQLSKALSPLQ